MHHFRQRKQQPTGPHPWDPHLIYIYTYPMKTLETRGLTRKTLEMQAYKQKSPSPAGETARANTAQWLVQQHDSNAVFNFCGSILFQV